MIPRNVILCGDVFEQLRTLPAESVHMVVTSPPYWSLRDYKVEGSVWGGDAACEHLFSEHHTQQRGGVYTSKTRWQHGGETAILRETNPEVWGHPEVDSGDSCAHCGAWRGAFGLEPTPELYVEHMTEIFREIRRVLRKDGTCWLNLGDSYAGSGQGMNADGQQGKSGAKQATNVGSLLSTDAPRQSFRRDRRDVGDIRHKPGLKPKDLAGIPWRVAFALQADGWWLRSDIVWSKPNPMPESVGDRPTRAHEYVFLLAKGERYYYDADAIRERYSPATLLRVSQASFDSQTGGPKDYAKTGAGVHSTRRAIENLKQKMVGGRRYAGFNDRWDAAESEQNIPGGRNKRSVWEVDEDEYAQFMQWKAMMGGDRRDVWIIATRPYAEAHFATYAPALIQPCILAGTSEHGVCGECGAPWERVTDVTHIIDPRPMTTGAAKKAALGEMARTTPQGRRAGSVHVRTTGWRATCRHHQPGAGMERPLVLDPFMGSGTTALVALMAGRDYLGIDLNPEYIEMAARRLAPYKNQGRLM